MSATRTTHASIGRLAITSVLVLTAAFLLIGSSADAKVRTFKPVQKTEHALFFKPRVALVKKIERAKAILTVRGRRIGHRKLGIRRVRRAVRHNRKLRVGLRTPGSLSRLDATQSGDRAPGGGKLEVLVARSTSGRRTDSTSTADPGASTDSGLSSGSQGDLGLNVAAPNSYSAKLSWGPAPTTADHIEVRRDGRLIDEIPSSSRSYTDYLLWESSSYRYELRVKGPGGGTVASQAQTVSTPRQSGGFPRPYAGSSPWNTPIPQGAPADPRSLDIINFSIIPHKSTANLSTTDTWGLALAYADPSSRRFAVGCTLYGCQQSVAGQIPSYAQPNGGSDGKLTVIAPHSGEEIDMWQGAYDSTLGTWSASSRFLADLNGSGFMCGEGQRCNGPNAAGNTGLAGVVRPEEIAQGHIDHALQLSGVSNYVSKNLIACPATHTDGNSSDPRAIPEGARIRLDPSFSVSAQPWPEWKKVIARALQQYGAIIDDKGGSLSVMGESNVNRGYDAWAKAGVTGSRSLADLPWQRMQVMKITQC